MTPDLVVICTPAASVPGLIGALGERGTRAAVVLSAGLRETVSESGESLTLQMLKAVRPYMLRIVGPNCLGILRPARGINASFAPYILKECSIAFVAQSSAVASAVLDWSGQRGTGFSHFLSIGDAAYVDAGDLLDYLGSDASASLILLYLEHITAARKFMSAARSAARDRPAIVVKAGRGTEGAAAAASHTGVLAGADEVYDAAIRCAGMLRVATIQDLFNATETLGRGRPKLGGPVTIITNGGGAGVMAADALAGGSGMLLALTEETIGQLDAALPSADPALGDSMGRLAPSLSGNDLRRRAVELELHSPLLGDLFAHAMVHAVRPIMAAFEAQAHRLYGPARTSGTSAGNPACRSTMI